MADLYDKEEPNLSESEFDSSSETSSQHGGDSVVEEFLNSDVEGGGSDDEEEEDEYLSDTDLGNRTPSDTDLGNKTPSLVDEMETDQTDDEDDDEEQDDDYLQKMNEDVRKKVIEDFHPELKTRNYEEVDALATVIRDKQNFIIDPLHQTLPILTRYEKARILGERARQINAGASPMIEVEPTLIDGYLIALKELEQKRIPFIIQRPLPNGTSEYWRVSDLE
jgi:DNA-directed RNA polymerase I, II, and III subunit RPABC2